MTTIPAALLTLAAVAMLSWLPAPGVPAPKPGQHIVCVDLYVGEPYCYLVNN